MTSVIEIGTSVSASSVARYKRSGMEYLEDSVPAQIESDGKLTNLGIPIT